MNQPDYPPHGVTQLAAIAALYGRAPISRVYRVPFKAAVAPGPSNTITFRWLASGLVLAMYGTTLGATAGEAAGLEARVQMNAKDLCTDGSAFDFMQYRALFGDAQNWFPLGVPVKEGQSWQVTFNNATVANITPSLYFALSEDAAR